MVTSHDGDSGRHAMSVEQAAVRLGIGRSLAYELVRDGKLRTVRAGHRILVPISSLEEFLSGPAASGVVSPQNSVD